MIHYEMAGNHKKYDVNPINLFKWSYSEVAKLSACFHKNRNILSCTQHYYMFWLVVPELCINCNAMAARPAEWQAKLAVCAGKRMVRLILPKYRLRNAH